MIIVSGCRRSGTSLMMRLLGMNLGFDRIYGEAHPMGIRKSPFDTQGMFELRREAMQPSPEIQEKRQQLQGDGVYECEYTISGLRYDYYTPLPPRNSIIKVVAEGLINTDPSLIDEIIFMVRDPYNMLLSHSKIIYKTPMFDDASQVFFEPLDPPGAIDQLLQASLFLNKYKGKLTLVQYETMSTTKLPYIEVGYGTIKPKAHAIIGNLDDGIWAELYKVYDLFQNHKFQDIINTIMRPDSFYAFHTRPWYCNGKLVDFIDCNNCDDLNCTYKMEVEKCKPTL